MNEQLIQKLDKRIEQSVNTMNKMLDEIELEQQKRNKMELKFKKVDFTTTVPKTEEEIKVEQENLKEGEDLQKLKEITIESKGVLPTQAHEGDAGFDLTATRITQELDEANKVVLVYHTDVAVEIPDGYVGLLFQRSSVSKKSLMLTNAVGVIDSGYRGEIMLKYKVTTDALPRVYQPGERVGQLVVVPFLQAKAAWAEELSETERGDKGYGSSDNKENK